jgi:hypothetical protein
MPRNGQNVGIIFLIHQKLGARVERWKMQQNTIFWLKKKEKNVRIENVEINAM